MLPLQKESIYLQKASYNHGFLKYCKKFLSGTSDKKLFHFRPREGGGINYDYEYDYDLVDRAPGYDIYTKKEAPHFTQKEGKEECQNYSDNEIKFETEYRNDCRSIYKTKCKIEYIEGHQCNPNYTIPCERSQRSGHKGKCAMRYKFECKQQNQVKYKGKI